MMTSVAMATTLTEVEYVDDRFAGVDIDSLLQGGRRTLSYERRRALYEAPEFIQRLSGEETVMEGQSLCIDCKIRGFPVPTVRWFKDDEEILDHPRMHVESDGIGGYFLLMDCVTRGDEAAYRCRAENVEGACSSFLFLSVKGKPKRRDPMYCPSWRTVSYPPMFSTIVEKVEEEEKLARECEGLSPSPMTEFYYALTLKSRCSWPTFLGAWAFAKGGPLAGRQNEEYDDDENEESADEDDSDIDDQCNHFLISKVNNCDSFVTRSPAKAHLAARKSSRRNDAAARNKAKKLKVDEEINNRKGIDNGGRKTERHDLKKLAGKMETERARIISINGIDGEMKEKTEMEKRLQRERDEHEEYEKRERMYKEEEEMRTEKLNQEENIKEDNSRKDGNRQFRETVVKDGEERSQDNNIRIREKKPETRTDTRKNNKIPDRNEEIEQNLERREDNKIKTAGKYSQDNARTVEDYGRTVEDFGRTERETHKEEQPPIKSISKRNQLEEEQIKLLGERKSENGPEIADEIVSSEARDVQKTDERHGQGLGTNKETAPKPESVTISRYAVSGDFFSGQLGTGSKLTDTECAPGKNLVTSFEESKFNRKSGYVSQFGSSMGRSESNTWSQSEDLNKIWKQRDDTTNSWKQRDDTSNSWKYGEYGNNSRRESGDVLNGCSEREDTSRRGGYQTSEASFKISQRHSHQPGGRRQKAAVDRDRLEELRQEEERYWEELKQEEQNRLEELRREEEEAAVSGRRRTSSRPQWEDSRLKEKKYVDELRRREQLQREELWQREYKQREDLWKREEKQKEDLRQKGRLPEMLTSHQQKDEIEKQINELKLKELSQTKDLKQREWEQMDELKFREFVQKEDLIAQEENPRLYRQQEGKTKQEMDRLRVEYKKEQLRKEQLKRQYEEDQKNRERRHSGVKMQRGVALDSSHCKETNRHGHVLPGSHQNPGQRMRGEDIKLDVSVLTDRPLRMVDTPRIQYSYSVNKENEPGLKARTSSKEDTEFSTTNRLDSSWEESWTRSLDRRPKKTTTGISTRHNVDGYHKRQLSMTDTKQQFMGTNGVQDYCRTSQTLPRKRDEKYTGNINAGSDPISSYSNGGLCTTSAAAQSATSLSFASLFNLDDTRGSSPGIRSHQELLKLAESIAANRERFHESLTRVCHDDHIRTASNSILDSTSLLRKDEPIHRDSLVHKRGLASQNDKSGDVEVIKKLNQSDNHIIEGSQTDSIPPSSSIKNGSHDDVSVDRTVIDIRPFICQSSRTIARRFHKKVTPS